MVLITMKLKSGGDYIDEFKIAWAGRLKLPLFSYLTPCYVIKLFGDRDEEVFSTVCFQMCPQIHCLD